MTADVDGSSGELETEAFTGVSLSLSPPLHPFIHLNGDDAGRQPWRSPIPGLGSVLRLQHPKQLSMSIIVLLRVVTPRMVE